MSLFLASLALPAAAQSRFGLGLDLLFEHQESLEVSAFRGTILTRDLLNGGEQSGQQPSDPAFLNRKFDLVWELEGTGVELPIELPGFGGLNPKLVLQAGVADVSLDFIGLRDRRDDAALSGRGPLFGAELEVEGSLFGSGPLSWSGSLRWQQLPSLTVDRSPAFRPEGFEVTADGVELSQQGFEVIGDEVRLSQEVQELTARVGYSVSGKAKSYLGVRYRRTDVTIEDELGYVDPLREIETRLASNTDLESEATLAIVGVETSLGRRFYGRVETAVGEGDRVVLAHALYRFPVSRPDELSSEQVAEIAVQLARIRAEFLEARSQLPMVVGPGGVRMPAVEAALDLINRTEEKLVRVLLGPQLAAMRDYVHNRAARTRQRLALESGSLATLSAKRQRAPIATVNLNSISKANFPLLRAYWAQADLNNTNDEWDFWIAVDTLYQRFKDDDIRVNVCVKTEPETRASVWIRAQSNKDLQRHVRRTNGWLKHVPRGDYVFKVERDQFATIDCLQGVGTDVTKCHALDLMEFDHPLVTCDLKSTKGGYCSVEDQPFFWRWSCEHSGP